MKYDLAYIHSKINRKERRQKLRDTFTKMSLIQLNKQKTNKKNLCKNLKAKISVRNKFFEIFSFFFLFILKNQINNSGFQGTKIDEGS